MHHCQTKKIKKFSGRAPRPLPLKRGYPLGAFGTSILVPSVLGVPVPFHLGLEH